jgi:hypothetical protein
MEVAGCAQNGIDRARLEAERTANAAGFIDQGDSRILLVSSRCVSGHGFATQKVGQSQNERFPAGWALINFGFMMGNRFSIGAASWKSTLCTLGLGKQGLNF